jgi:hypothetical protein
MDLIDAMAKAWRENPKFTNKDLVAMLNKPRLDAGQKPRAFLRDDGTAYVEVEISCDDNTNYEGDDDEN